MGFLFCLLLLSHSGLEKMAPAPAPGNQVVPGQLQPQGQPRPSLPVPGQKGYETQRSSLTSAAPVPAQARFLAKVPDPVSGRPPLLDHESAEIGGSVQISPQSSNIFLIWPHPVQGLAEVSELQSHRCTAVNNKSSPTSKVNHLPGLWSAPH